MGALRYVIGDDGKKVAVKGLGKAKPKKKAKPKAKKKAKPKAEE